MKIPLILRAFDAWTYDLNNTLSKLVLIYDLSRCGLLMPCLIVKGVQDVFSEEATRGLRSEKQLISFELLAVGVFLHALIIVVGFCFS